MDLSNDLISKFVKITNDDKNKNSESTVYGTVVEYNGGMYVRIDGSDLLTPVETTADFKPNERVTVMIKNHSATVTGNITSPATNEGAVTEKVTEAVEEVEGKVITEVEILIADRVSTKQLDAEVARIDELIAGKASVEDLTATNAEITNLKADKASIKDLTATNAEITNLKAKDAEIENLVADKARIEDLTATNAEITNLKAKDAEIENLVADKARIEDLTATNARIDSLQANKADITYLDANFATIDELEAAHADIEILDAEVANINTLVNGNLTSDNILSLNITSQNTTMENAFVKDAMIDTVTANKIMSGTIDTNNVTIQSTDGSMLLQGTLLQMKDDNGKVRIQIGKDTGGNFTFILYDESGTGVLIDEEGIKSSDAIADGLIVDAKVADNANIAGSKLNIASVITEVNKDNSTTIKSNKIYLDEQGQSLEVAFNSLKTQVETIQDVTIDGDLTAVIEQVQSNTTQIAANKEGISTLVSENTIRKEEIQNLDGEIESVSNTLSSKYSSLEQDVSGFKTTVADTYTTKSEFNNLQIGGTNTFKISKVGSETWDINYNSSFTDNSENGFNVSTADGRMHTRLFHTIKDNGYWTVSFKVKSSVYVGPIHIDICDKDAGDFTSDTNWSEVTRTVLVDNYSVDTYNFVDIEQHIDCGQAITYYFKDVKVEKGNRPTAWSPAPEDVQGQIDATNNNLATNYSTTSAMNSAIQQKANEITSTVSQTYATKQSVTDVNNNLANNYSTTSQMNSAIQQKANEITSSVSETYTTKSEFNNLQIGGKNLLLDSKREITNNNYLIGSFRPTELFEVGEKYTVSICVTPANGVDYITPFISEGYNTLSNGFAVNGATKQVLSKTFTFDRYALDRVPVDIYDSNADVQFYRYPDDGTVTSDTTLHWVKVEKGAKATDWSPAPEDVQGQIDATNNNLTNNYSTTSAMNSAIQQKANEITSSVSETYATKQSVTDVSNNLATNYSTTSAMNSAIQQKANEITSSVSETYTTKSEFNSLQIGGTNLIQNGNFKGVIAGSTSMPSPWTFWGNDIHIYGSHGAPGYNHVGCVYIGCNLTDGSRAGIYSNRVHVSKVEKGANYMASFILTMEGNVKGATAHLEYLNDARDQILHSQVLATARVTNNVVNGLHEHQYHIPFTMWTGDFSYVQITFNHGGTNAPSNGYLMIVGNVQIEKGNKATDWSPAPEDVQGQIDATNANLQNNYSTTSQMNSAIQQKANEITSTVSQTYATKQSVTDINNNLSANYSTTSQMNSAIQQKANEITSSVSQTYTTKAEFNNLEVGGTNLIYNGGFNRNLDGWHANGNSNYAEACGESPSGYMLRIDATNHGNGAYQMLRFHDSTYCTDYVVSFYAKTNVAGSQMYVSVEGDPGTSSVFTLNEGWQKCVYKFRRHNPGVNAIVFYASGGGTRNIYIHSIKMEKGTVPSAWSPHPSEIENKVDNLSNNLANNYSTTSAMNSAIQQKANEITSSVSQTYATKQSVTDVNNNLVNNYSTTSQMNSAIQQKANEITSSVSQTYATKSEAAMMNDTVVGYQKWLFEQYTNNQNVGTGNGTYPTLAHLANETLTSSRLVDSLPGSASELGSNYLGVYTVYLYYESAYTWSGSITSDDESTTYLNGVAVCQAPTCTPTTFTMNFKKGINKLQIIHGEGGGGDGVSLSDLGPWKEYGAYPACVTAASSNHYASNSDIVQTANDLTIKFTESGGYNLLQNGHADKGTSYWTDNGGGITTHANAGGGATGNFFGTSLPHGIAYYDWVKLLPNTHYVYQAKVWTHNPFNGAGSAPLHFWFSYDCVNGTADGYTILDYQQNVPVGYTWTQCYIHFVTGNNDIFFKPIIWYNSVSADVFYVTELMLSQSRVVQPWSPHPSEVYSGITQIDKDGIRVHHSNANSYTHMAPDGFFVNNNGTDVVQVTASGLYVQGNITSGSTIQGARITGSTFNSSNDVFQVLEDGTIETSYLAVNGAVSTDKLNVNDIENASYPKVLSEATTVYISPNGGVNAEEFYDGAYFTSLSNMLSVAPRNLNGYTLTIKLMSDLYENAALTWFHSGQVNFEMQGYTLYGYFYGYGASMCYRLYGNTNANNNGTWGHIKPNVGRAMGSYYYAVQFQYCQFAVNYVAVYPSASSGSSSGGIGVHRGATGIIFNAKACGDMRYLVRAEYAGRVHVNSTQGACNNATFCASTGGIITLNSSNNQAGRSTTGNPYWVGSGGLILCDQLLGMDKITFNNTSQSGSSSSSGSTTRKVTETVKASSADTYRSTVYNNWKGDGTVRQGDYGYGDCQGCWFFGNNLYTTMNAGTVTKVVIRIQRQSGGVNALQTLTVKSHNHTSRPSGAPTYTDTIGTCSCAVGSSIDLVITDQTTINKLKKCKGLGLSIGSASSPYAVCSGACSVIITYTTNS